MVDHNESKKITIYDVAKEAHVSVATVSRVLTGSAPVREKTRSKVQAIIDKYGFQPNAIARYLSNQKTSTLGTILPDITNPFFSTFFLKLQEYALKQGYTMLLWNSMNDRDMESRALQSLKEEQVDGIIFMGGRINDSVPLAKHVHELNDILINIPIVMVNGYVDNVDCHRIYTDETGGILALVEYLAGLGHKKLGFVGSLPEITTSDFKCVAYLNALDQFNLKGHDCIVRGGFSVEDGMKGMEEILSMSEQPTAVIAVNDLAAIGAIKAAHKHNLRVPDDISIAGFDNSYLSTLYTPEITTVDQNYTVLSETAIDLLISQIDGESSPKDMMIPTELIIRESCSQPKK